METLYEMTDAYIKANEAITIDDETGEVIGWEMLEEIEDNIDDKLESIACLYKESLAMAEALKAEEKNLEARRTAYEKKAEWLKNYMSESMLLVGKTKLERPRANLRFIKSESVRILDNDAIPVIYTSRKVTYSPNKVAIKKAIKSGIKVDGAVLDVKENLQVK